MRLRERNIRDRIKITIDIREIRKYKKLPSKLREEETKGREKVGLLPPSTLEVEAEAKARSLPISCGPTP